ERLFMGNRRSFMALFLLSVTLLAAVGTARGADLQEMVRQSSAIFVGTCQMATSRWDEVSRMIFTDATFRAQSYVKGDLGPMVTITEPGGILPDMNLMMMSPDFPRFAPGEEVVLFVWVDPNGTRRVVGGRMGKFVVTSDAGINRKRVGVQDLA